MINYLQGNLLESEAEALVNTVNTVGVMGKGVALMFKERFPENYRQYVAACKAKELQTGHIFVTKVNELTGPRWIVNFPTKKHWKSPSQIIWIEEGLQDLRRFLIENQVKSVAIPPLGAGNGGLDWTDVRPRIEKALADLDTVVWIYEPTSKYQNVAKRSGLEKLTPPRALIAELVRRYWVLGVECSLLEIQKLAWFLERAIEDAGLKPLDLKFEAHRYGPYAARLTHLMEALDGSYLHCEKRIKDAQRLEPIWFEEQRKSYLQAYLNSEASSYKNVLDRTTALIDGFESPFGLELLSTVDWLLARERVQPTVEAIRKGLNNWPVSEAGSRKAELFDDRVIKIALDRLISARTAQATPA